MSVEEMAGASSSCNYGSLCFQVIPFLWQWLKVGVISLYHCSCCIPSFSCWPFRFENSHVLLIRASLMAYIMERYDIAENLIHLVSVSSVQLLSHVNSLRPHGLQHARLPYLSPTARAYSNSCPVRQWCHPAISSSVVPFSSCPQSLPASESFPMSQFFASGGQSIGVSASASVLSMNIQDWFLLGWIGWISSQSKGFSRVFPSTTVQKHQFFGTHLSL